MNTTKILWEVLIPRYSNEGKEYSVKHHHAWDNIVRKVAGGITILRTTKGHWVNPDGRVFVEEMIPVRIYCTEKQIDEIIDQTLEYYNQEAVFTYQISSRVKIKTRNSSKVN